MHEEFLDIPRSKLTIVNEYRSRICDLFGVKVSVCNNEDDTSNVKIKVVHQGRISSKDISNIKAKEYVKSLTGISEDHCSCSVHYQPKVYEILQKSHENIEKQSQAVVSFSDNKSPVVISGQSFNVAVAKSLMERVKYCFDNSDVNHLTVNTSSSTTTTQEQDVLGSALYYSSIAGQGGEEECNKHTTLMHTLSPGGESSHDSCYDSDWSPSSSRRNSTHHLDADFHSDVSRTTSDTLAAELGEKDDLKVGSEVGGNSSSKHLPENGDNVPLTDLLSSSEYISKVEFALKLGYTEEQIKSALFKLGTDVDPNALLSELIKLGSQDPHSSRTKGSVISSVNNNNSHLSLEGSKSLTHLESKSSGSHNDDHSNLRPIVIDGSNVAMSHGNKDFFSCQGIKLAVEFFRQRGHSEITVFVPQWRKEASRTDSPIADQEVLYDLERDKQLVFTPARRVGGKRVICYDDRYIIKLASENGGVIVSNDNYRDLLNESPEFKQVIEERLLMYSFVNDRFMPPDDPLGRHGPTLDQFLRKENVAQEPLTRLCPYEKKCTYGNKCKYYHPERGNAPHKSVTDKLKEEAIVRIKHAKEKGLLTSTNSIGDPRLLASHGKKPLTGTKSLTYAAPPQKKALSRTKSLIPEQSNSLDSFAYAGRGLNSTDITRSSSPVFSRSLSPSLTLTPAPGDQDGLSEQSIHGESSKGKRSPGRKSNYSSPRRSPSPREISPRANQMNVGPLLKVPQNTQHLAVMHEALRNVHSDPTSSFYKRDVASVGGAHVNLVKKLSESGRMCMDDNSCYLMHQRGADITPHHQSLTKSASIGEVAKQQEEQTVHKKLQRQLSLKGPEDPRIRNKQPQSKSNVPIVQFHSPAVPVGPVIQQHPQQRWMHPTAAGMQMNNYQMAFNPNMQFEPDLHRQSVYNRHAANNMPAEFHGDYGRKMQENLKLPETVKAHTPLGRMSSAPESFGGNKQGIIINRTQPLMNRQNSNSDSHINIQKDELITESDKDSLLGVYGDPRWAFEGSISGQVREQLERTTQRKWPPKAQPAKESDVFYFMPDGSHQRKTQNTSVNQQLPGGIKVAFGATPSTFSRASLCRTGGFTAPGRATPGAPPSATHQHSVSAPQKEQTIQQQQHDSDTSASNVLMEGQGNKGISEDQSSKGDLLSSGSNNNKDAPEKDARQQIFFHLCGLFNEENVRKVMTEHPEENNPQVLCAYLLAFK